MRVVDEVLPGNCCPNGFGHEKKNLVADDVADAAADTVAVGGVVAGTLALNE